MGSELGLQPGSPPFKLLHNVLPSQHGIRMLTRCARTEKQLPLLQLEKKTLPERERGVDGSGLVPPLRTLGNRLTNSGTVLTIALVCACLTVNACDYI